MKEHQIKFFLHGLEYNQSSYKAVHTLWALLHQHN